MDLGERVQEPLDQPQNRFRVVPMGRMSAVNKHLNPNGDRYTGGHGLNLGGGAVGIIVPLDHQNRDRDTIKCVCNVPVPKPRV